MEQRELFIIHVNGMGETYQDMIAVDSITKIRITDTAYHITVSGANEAITIMKNDRNGKRFEALVRDRFILI